MPSYEEMLDSTLLASSRGKLEEAAAVAALLEAYPSEPAGPALNALATLWRGDLEGAQRLAKLLDDSPPQVAVKAEILGYEGDLPTAKQMLEAALAQAPEDPIVLRCAYSIHGIDEPDRAFELANKRVALRPHDPAAHASIGTCLLTRSVPEAEAFAADPPAAYAETHQHWVLRARLAMKRHDLATAEECARAAVAACSDSDSAWETLADILKNQGRKAEAADAARFSLDLNRRNPRAMRILAADAAARGNRAEADRWNQEAATAIPALAFLERLHTANHLVKQGKPKDALAELDKLSNMPGITRKAVRTIRLNILLGLNDDAALAAEVSALETEGSGEVLLERGRAEVDRRAGRTAEARARLEAVWQSERSGQIAAPLIALLNEMNDREALEEIARQVIAQVPGLPDEAAMVFVNLDQAGLKEEARAFLSAAQRQYPSAQGLQLLRAGTLAEDGNMSAMMHTIQGLEPEYRPVIRLRFRHVLKLLWKVALKRRRR